MKTLLHNSISSVKLFLTLAFLSLTIVATAQTRTIEGLFKGKDLEDGWSFILEMHDGSYLRFDWVGIEKYKNKTQPFMNKKVAVTGEVGFENGKLVITDVEEIALATEKAPAKQTPAKKASKKKNGGGLVGKFKGQNINGGWRWTLEGTDGKNYVFSWYSIRDYKEEVKNMTNKTIAVLGGKVEEKDGLLEIMDLKEIKPHDGTVAAEPKAQETKPQAENTLVGKVRGQTIDGAWFWTLDANDGKNYVFSWYSIRDYKEEIKTLQKKTVVVKGQQVENEKGVLTITNLKELKLHDATAMAAPKVQKKEKRPGLNGVVRGRTIDGSWFWTLEGNDGKCYIFSWYSIRDYKKKIEKIQGKEVDVIQGKVEENEGQLTIANLKEIKVN